MFKLVGFGIVGFCIAVLVNAMLYGWLIMLGWGIIYHETEALNSTIGFWPATLVGLILGLLTGALRGDK